MANLLISTVCNLRCAYCFARDHLNGHDSAARFISLETFAAQLDFLERSEIDEVRLLGGEPTLHPQFPALIECAAARNKRIVVFTNGLMPRPALASLERLPVERCLVLVNINAPADSTPAILQRQRTVLQRLGKRAMPGFNIYRPDFQFEFLFDLITETECKPAIRLGLAQPCLSGDNRYIHPKQYRFIGQKIVQQARVAATHNIALDSDCGFVRCMFTDGELAELRELGMTFGWHCNPILDIDLQGQVIHCYPLAQLASQALFPTSEAAALRAEFEAITKPYRQAGIFAHCATCVFKARGQCSGGCLAATIRRFRAAAFEIAISAEATVIEEALL